MESNHDSYPYFEKSLQNTNYRMPLHLGLSGVFSGLETGLRIGHRNHRRAVAPFKGFTDRLLVAMVTLVIDLDGGCQQIFFPV